MECAVTKTSDLCDARDDVQACALVWISLGQRRAFSGRIRTFRFRDGLSALRDLVNSPGHGQVLVVDGGGMLAGALFGDVMAGLAIRNGWVGVIVNGLVRDRSEIDAMDIGMKALGTIPRRAQVAGSGEVDAPVAFGGATFAPGRWLVADEDGVVVLPEGVAEADIDVRAVTIATAAYATGGA